jgi:hypothetical protein
MSHISESFPRHIWGVLFVLAAVATLGLFVPPSLTQSLGLSIVEHIIVIGVVEFSSAVGIGGLVVAYRDTEYDEPEWRYDP